MCGNVWPTTGDRVRLADTELDTELLIEIEHDFMIYGEEVKFGGGKVIRAGMGSSERIAKDVVDAVITNAVIVDYTGILKADIGIKDGRVAGMGKAGNPGIQLGVTIAIGPGNGDLLEVRDGCLVRVVAAPERVLCVTADEIGANGVVVSSACAIPSMP